MFIAQYLLLLFIAESKNHLIHKIPCLCSVVLFWPICRYIFFTLNIDQHQPQTTTCTHTHFYLCCNCLFTQTKSNMHLVYKPVISLQQHLLSVTQTFSRLVHENASYKQHADFFIPFFITKNNLFPEFRTCASPQRPQWNIKQLLTFD